MSFCLGILGSILYATQMIWNWFGTDSIQKTIYSLICVVLLLSSCASAYVSGGRFKTQNKGTTFAKFLFFGFIIVLLLVCIVSGASMTMDTNVDTYFKSDLGFFTGMRMLTTVTDTDVNALMNFGLGFQVLIKSLFLCVPFLIATWGALSVITAESIDEAEGGIMAIVAALFTVIIIFVFSLVGIYLS